jgi:hypothetical protein
MCQTPVLVTRVLFFREETGPGGAPRRPGEDIAYLHVVLKLSKFTVNVPSGRTV